MAFDRTLAIFGEAILDAGPQAGGPVALYVKLHRRLTKDQRVPLHTKGMFLAALFYLISRVDPIPETDQRVPGQIDDVAVSPFSGVGLQKPLPN